MKGPLSAERLFFISALMFVVGYISWLAIGYIWPVPVIPDELLAQLPMDPIAEPGTFPYFLSQANWFLSIGGVVTFALGLIARKS